MAGRDQAGFASRRRCDLAVYSPSVSSVRVVERIEDLDRYVTGWDGLACAARQPLAAPGWLLAWWQSSAPPGALLRIVLLEDDDGSLVGVAPFFANPGRFGRWDYRLMGAPITQGRELLSARGWDVALAAALARVLGEVEPAPSIVAFEAIRAGSEWPELVAGSYRSRLRPRVVRRLVQSAPVVTLSAGSFDGWLAGKSANFRQQLRRTRRHLEAAGGRLRTSDAAHLAADVAAFLRLHRARWDWRGGSSLPASMDALLVDAGARLVLGDRMRLWIAELDGHAIGAGLFIAGGGEVAYVNGGFDEEHAQLKPTLLVIAAAIEDAFERGDHRVDLGGGGQPYKWRFADSDDPITWASLRMRDASYPVTAAQMLGGDVRWWARTAFRRMPEDCQAKIEEMRSRVLHRGR